MLLLQYCCPPCTTTCTLLDANASRRAGALQPQRFSLCVSDVPPRLTHDTMLVNKCQTCNSTLLRAWGQSRDSHLACGSSARVALG